VKKTIGVLGGMGPEATAYFFGLIVERTRAGRDQDHVPVIIDCNPKIPDRTAAIMGEGPSPARPLLAGARRLAHAGAGFVVVPCVSAHAFLPWVRERSPVPFVDLVDETCLYVRRSVPKLKKVGLLATTGTVRSGMFDAAFRAAGMEVLVPADDGQRRLMDAIYGRAGIKAGAKSGRPRARVLAVCRELIRRGAQAIIAGCTEIPLVIAAEDISVPLIEPMRIAAEACILKAGYTLRA
jgi:aspartate racemase